MLCSSCASPACRHLVISEPGVTKRISDSEKVTDLENEILGIESKIESLVIRRTIVRRKLNMFSLSSRLPAEILTLIFKLACEPSEDSQPTSLAPLFLGSIYNEWREIVWSTPLLWNSLSIHLSRKTDNNSQIQLSKDWLLRARSLPLHIKITVDNEHAPKFGSFRATMETLATRSSNWSSLYAFLPSQCNDIFKINHFPALTSICINPPRIIVSEFGKSQKFELLSAPKLLDVEIARYSLSDITLPWNQLQRFKKDGCLSVEQSLKVLERCPNLKEYHLECYGPERFPSYVSTLLRSELTVLDVVLKGEGTNSFLENVVLPSLRDLRIQFKTLGEGNTLFPIIKSLVIRSSCKLQSLHLEKEGFHEDDLISCLESLLSLSTLHLITTGSIPYPSLGLTTKVIAMLHPSHQFGHPFLPNLLTLEYRGPVQCDEDSLMSMLSDRWQIQSLETGTHGLEQSRIARLCSVSIIATGGTSFSAEFEVGIERLVEEGMFLDIGSSSQSFRCVQEERI